MRLLKAFLVGAVGLFIIITLFSLLIPSRVRVSRAVIVTDVPIDSVRHQVADFSNWHHWHPVFTKDSAQGTWQSSENGAPNAVFRISHRKQQVVITPQPSDTTATRFLLQAAGENDVDNEIVVLQLESQHAVQVEWRAITKLSWYPWQKFYGIFIDQLTGPGYEAALNDLKTFLEQRTLSPQ